MAIHSKFTANATINLGKADQKYFLHKFIREAKQIANEMSPICKISNENFIKIGNDLTFQADFFIGRDENSKLLQIHLDSNLNTLTSYLPLFVHAPLKSLIENAELQLDKRDNAAHNFTKALMLLCANKELDLVNPSYEFCY